MCRSLTALSLVLSLLGGPLAAGATAACRDCVSAGAARVALAVPGGTPLAGYGDRVRRLLVPDVLGRHPHAFWFRPSVGTLDPLAVRALVLDGGGRRLTWLTADLVAVDRAFTARVARALEDAGLPRGTVIVSASHTHSGPGAFMQSGVLGVVAVDRYDREVADALVGSLVEAARRAEAARTPARVGSARIAAPGLTRSRLDRAIDRELVLVRFVSDAGRPIASLWNYAIHGTVLPAGNLRLSGDVMGIAGREIERVTGVPALFVNGAVGDVSPSRHGEIEAEGAGLALAAAARSAWDAVKRVSPATLEVVSTRVALPAPVLSVRNCTFSWVTRALSLPLTIALPAETELIGGRLGDVGWVTIPGELQSRLGEGIKRAGRPGLDRVFVAGLSNEYLGYFLSAADYDRVSYIACASLYGPEGGERLAEAAERLIRELASAPLRR